MPRFVQADDALIVTGPLSMQGNCTAHGISQNAPNNLDPTVSLWSCTGQSQSPLNFYFRNGASESCLYIDNLSSNAYFVPLKTFTEWNAYKQSVQFGTMSSVERLVYGCRAAAVDDTCGTMVSLPDARNGTAITITANERTATYTCEASNGCGTWRLTNTAGYCPVNGMCGAANGRETSTAPASDLCSAGTPTTVTGTGPWTWTCEGVKWPPILGPVA